MIDIFYQLVNLSKILCVMIITVILLRMLLSKAPKKVHKTLWLMVGIRACLPYYIKSNMGIIPSNSALVAISDYGITQAEPVKKVFTPNVSSDMTNVIGTSLHLEDVMAFIWITGVILFMMYMLINYVIIKNTVADACHVKENIYISDNIPSPFIIGYFKPRIYILPEMNQAQQDLIVAHERCHLKNKDHILKALGFILLGIYWFNPLMWIAYFLFCKDIELSCDEEVIKSLPFDLRKKYAFAILDSTQNTNILVFGVAFCENSVKERIISVMKYKKPKFWIIATAIVACIAVLVVFFTVKKTSKNSEYVTYEFETFDGITVKIDDTNIISQQVEENVLENHKVPKNAEVIAPGRDYVYLADEKYYYVEDATKDLLTIASKNSANGDLVVAEYTGDDYSFKYNSDCFSLFEDKESNSITLSYTKDDVDIAGSNVITFNRIDNTTCMDLLKKKVSALEGNVADIKEVAINENIKKACVYSYSGESQDSGLKTTQTYYAIQSKDNVILIDEFRTIGPNDALEKSIDSEIKYVLDSFICK